MVACQVDLVDLLSILPPLATNVLLVDCEESFALGYLNEALLELDAV